MVVSPPGAPSVSLLQHTGIMEQQKGQRLFRARADGLFLDFEMVSACSVEPGVSSDLPRKCGFRFAAVQHIEGGALVIKVPLRKPLVWHATGAREPTTPILAVADKHGGLGIRLDDTDSGSRQADIEGVDEGPDGREVELLHPSDQRPEQVVRHQEIGGVPVGGAFGGGT